MRHIKYNPANISYPTNWAKEAASALKIISSATDADRAEIISKFQPIWSSLKSELAKLSYNKCWYTECLQEGTDSDVDHFRPKNAVYEAKKIRKKKHPGYWWLAFTPSNYRFSCIIANRRRKDIVNNRTGGKADRFPVEDEQFRAWLETDDYTKETPLLIDPCKADEVKLIIFGENGEANVRYKETENLLKYKMADQSIKIYHINHDDFVKARIRIREGIERRIERIKENFDYLLVDENSTLASNNYWYFIEELNEMCDEKTPHSSFAISMLEKYKLEVSLSPVMHNLQS